MPDDRVIAGKYRLIAKLSKGGMGAVWRAQHLELDCPAAVKLLDPVYADSLEALARFKREAQSAASLRSAHIVQIFDFGVDCGTPYIAMELLQGHSLADHLAARAPLGPAETALILSQVARAVAWAHSRGIIHRDLKPGNIFISEDAGESVVKLVDFGIAKPARVEMRDAPVTVTGAIMGTPQYMSPEQASGRGQVDHRTDIWSFGIVAFECLTGYHAFAAETLASLLLAICTDPLPIPSAVGPVPPDFDDWFAQCVQRDPNLRFASIAHAAEELRKVCGVAAETRLRSVPVQRAELPETLCSNSADKRVSAEVPSTPVTPASTHSASIMSVAESGVSRSRRAKLLMLVVLLGTGATAAALGWLALGSAPERTVKHQQAAGALPKDPSPIQEEPVSSLPLAGSVVSGPIVLLPNDSSDVRRASGARKPTLRRSTAARSDTRAASSVEWAPLGSTAASAVARPAVVPVPPASPAMEETVESEFGFNRTATRRGKP
jgi:serine/threonine-protein kinase